MSETPELSPSSPTPKAVLDPWDFSGITKEQLQAAPAVAIWQQYEDKYGDQRRGVNITLRGFEFAASVDAYVTADWGADSVTEVLEAGTLSVDEEIRGMGIGERLTRLLGKVAADEGFQSMEIDFLHPASFKHCVRVFGRDRVHLMEKDRFGPNYRDLNLSEEEVIQRIIVNRSKATQYGKTNLRKVPSTLAVIDLDGLDTSDWEEPIVVNVPEDEDPYWLNNPPTVPPEFIAYDAAHIASE